MTTRFHRADFPTTRWSLIACATDSSDAEQQNKALADLCRLYWLPIYAFARRSGFGTQDAEDLTQEFFSALINGDLLSQTSPASGRLRTYLLRVFSNDLTDARRAQDTKKRGGGVKLVSIDQMLAEQHLAAEMSHHETPERLYGRVWALRVLESALQWVEQEYTEAGKADLFAALRPSLDLQGDGIDYDTLAATTGMSKVAARQAVSRLRASFREALRCIVADTLVNPTTAELEEEISNLQNALR
jgi:RNA polymerase sigma factor (sigma-70 family)